MNKKLFVGRLPFGFSNDQLRNLFIKLGTVVSAVMVPDAKSGKTRGFGFVDMSTEAEAQAAIQALNGSPLEDKKIWVTLAREKGEAKQSEERPPFPPRSRRPFNDRSGPPMRGRPSFSNDRPSFGPKKPAPYGSSEGRRPGGGHFTDSTGTPSGERKPPFRGKRGFSGGDSRPAGSSFGDRPPFRGGDRPSRPSFGDRGPSRGGEGRPSGAPPRKSGPSREGFRGPPKRTGGRRPPPRG